jgi:hypothetical protein
MQCNPITVNVFAIPIANPVIEKGSSCDGRVTSVSGASNGPSKTVAVLRFGRTRHIHYSSFSLNDESERFRALDNFLSITMTL